VKISRRRFLKRSAIAVAGVGAATGLYSWRIEPHWLEIVSRPLPLPLLPPDLAGRTLVLISDLHIGPNVDDDYVIETFARVAALRPDYVAVAGDFITYSGPQQFDQLARVLQHFPHGHRATVASLGNHDYGPNWSHPAIAERVTAIATNAGVDVLRNRSTIVGGLQIAGVDDLWGGEFDPETAFASLDPRAATIVLSHNPDTVDLPRWGSYQSWIFSGHTHGGQCKPPFLPPPLLPVNNKRYTSGEFSLAANRRLYISRGVGHLMRVRFNVRPEVTMFHLSRDV